MSGGRRYRNKEAAIAQSVYFASGLKATEFVLFFVRYYAVRYEISSSGMLRRVALV
jgi:hypothetical protein